MRPDRAGRLAGTPATIFVFFSYTYNGQVCYNGTSTSLPGGNVPAEYDVPLPGMPKLFFRQSQTKLTLHAFSWRESQPRWTTGRRLLCHIRVSLLTVRHSAAYPKHTRLNRSNWDLWQNWLNNVTEVIPYMTTPGEGSVSHIHGHY